MPTTCSPLPRGDGAETGSCLYHRGWYHPLAVPFPGAMALKRLMRRPTALDESLAVPFPGAMALKRPQDTPRRTSPTLAVPFPGAMALKPVAEMRRQSPGFSLAVPFPGAMALKQAHQNRTEEQREPCSPLPRGDGAETYPATNYICVLADLAVPCPVE